MYKYAVTKQKLMQCEKCNFEAEVQIWPYHLKIKNHLDSDPDQTINQPDLLNFVKNVM